MFNYSKGFYLIIYECKNVSTYEVLVKIFYISLFTKKSTVNITL